MTGLAPKSDFIALEGTSSLVAGGEPPLLQRHRDAFEAYAHDKARGFVGYWDHWSVNEEVRTLLAEMLKLATDDISLTGSASEGIAQVVSSIDWRNGDNAVTAEMEYASGRFAFSGLRKFGVDARSIDSRGWRIDAEQLVQACDERTRLVYISQVNYQTGQQMDIDCFFRHAHACGMVIVCRPAGTAGRTIAGQARPVPGSQHLYCRCCCLAVIQSFRLMESW